jgi:hypothetical protein
MGWATFWAIFSQTHLVTLLNYTPLNSHLIICETGRREKRKLMVRKYKTDLRKNTGSTVFLFSNFFPSKKIAAIGQLLKTRTWGAEFLSSLRTGTWGRAMFGRKVVEILVLCTVRTS